jgi:hypothetical protein
MKVAPPLQDQSSPTSKYIDKRVIMKLTARHVSKRDAIPEAPLQTKSSPPSKRTKQRKNYEMLLWRVCKKGHPQQRPCRFKLPIIK